MTPSCALHLQVTASCACILIVTIPVMVPRSMALVSGQHTCGTCVCRTGPFVYRNGQFVSQSLDLYMALEFCNQVRHSGQPAGTRGLSVGKSAEVPKSTSAGPRCEGAALQKEQRPQWHWCLLVLRGPASHWLEAVCSLAGGPLPPPRPAHRVSGQVHHAPAAGGAQACTVPAWVAGLG